MYIVYNIIKRYHIMISHGRMEGETLNIVLIANIVALVGSLLMVGVGLLKKKNQILLIQCVQFSIQGAANLLLGGMTGVIANAVSIARNLFCLKFEYTAGWKVIFLAVQVMLSLGTNNLGMLGWLPVISAMIYTWFLDVKDEVQLKIVMIAAQIMWVIYDFMLMNYVAFAFDLLTIGSNSLGIRLILKERKAERGQQLCRKNLWKP